MTTSSVELPRCLSCVKGETLGQKMESITTMAVSYYDWVMGDVEISGRGFYETIEDLSLALIDTGIGDWIRGTRLWKDFQCETERLFKLVIERIKSKDVK